MHQPEVLLETRRFKVVRLWQQAADGSHYGRETVQHPGAVTILPLVDEEHVCLIQNYRLAVGRTLVELPAGTLEPAEHPDATARRELEEETGYRAGTMQPLTQFYMSPGILNERMHLYLARNLVAGSPRLDHGEQIQVLVVTWTEAMAMALDGRIEDAKTLAGLLWYDCRRRHADGGRHA